jgi:hypothetical protein
VISDNHSYRSGAAQESGDIILFSRNPGESGDIILFSRWCLPRGVTWYRGQTPFKARGFRRGNTKEKRRFRE